MMKACIVLKMLTKQKQIHKLKTTQNAKASHGVQ